MSLRLLTCGEYAVLVELDGLEEVLTLYDVVRAALKAGDGAFAEVVDVVPAARTLLLVVGDGAQIAPVRLALKALPPKAKSGGLAGSGAARGALGNGAGPTGTSGLQVTAIRVHYDGPDLDEVSRLTALSRGEVIAAHTGRPWRVAFAGFSPGFAYLAGGDSRLQVPRRSEPRTSVPSGAVGLAGEFSAVYPRSSPGGWQLLGHTDAVLWDVDRQPPALLQPGSLVRFVDAASG
jgi:allophanate hydrolase subunit 1